MSSIFRAKIPLLHALKTGSSRRFLSDKPRNRTWNLPPVKPNNSSPIPSKPTNTTGSQKSSSPPIRPTPKTSPIKKTPNPSPSKGDTTPRKLEDWAARKLALKQKYPEGWRPTKRLSPDAIEGIRILHRQV
jgi:hypothetical protein